MALIVEAVGQSGVVERITVEAGAAVINAQPGLTYRILDASGRPVNASATVRRVGDHLIIEGLPEETTIQLADFFFVCTPSDPCSLDLEGLGGARGETINQISEPIAALADGSFVLHAPASMATPVAPEAEFSAKPALAGLALLGLVGGGGGGGGGGDGPPPPPPGSTTVTSPALGPEGKLVTNDLTPVIAGTAQPGAIITVTLDIPGTGPVTFSTQANGDGNWAVDTGSLAPTTGAMPPGGLPSDAPTVLRVLTVGSGEGPISYQLVMDLEPPGAPTINPVTDDNVLSAEEARGAEDSPVTVSGTAEPGATVRVVWRDEGGNDDHVRTVRADADGNWSADFNGWLIIDGTYTVIATAVDLAGNVGESSSLTVRVDTNVPTAPEFDLVTGDNRVNAAEASTGIELTGDTTPNTRVFVSFNGTEYEATVTGERWSVQILVDGLPAVDGTFEATAYAVYVSDTGGTNPSRSGSSGDIVFDRSPPAAPVISGDSLINAQEAGQPVTFTGTAEAGSTVAVTWGDTTRTVAADGGTWSATFLPSEIPADGSRPVTAIATDAAGNPSAPGSLAVVVDRQGPTVSITGDSTSPINGPVSVTVSFNEPVIGFDASDVVVANGTVTGVTGSGASYTVTINPGNEGEPMTVQVPAARVTDQAGNANAPSNSLSFTIDKTGPLPTITAPTETQEGPFTVSIKFDENVTGFTPDKVVVVNGTAASSFSGGDGTKTFDLVVTPDPGEAGNVTINVPSSPTTTDAAGNANRAAAQVVVPFDTVQPTLDITDETSAEVTNSSVIFVFSFSKAMADGEFTLGEIDIDGGQPAASGLQRINSQSFRLEVNPDPDIQNGTIEVAVPGYTNSSGNPSAATQDFDTRAPVLSPISVDEENGDLVFRFTFDEPVHGFRLVHDVNVDFLSGSGAVSEETPWSDGIQVFELRVTPTGSSGTIDVEVEAASATDAVGNPIPGASTRIDFDFRTIEITELLDDVEPGTGNVGNPGSGNDNSPTVTVTLSGPLQPGEVVLLFREGLSSGLLGTQQGGNTWEFEDSITSMTEETFTYRAEVRTTDGDVLLFSNDWVYTYTPPI